MIRRRETATPSPFSDERAAVDPEPVADDPPARVVETDPRGAILRGVRAGTITQAQACHDLKVSKATLHRLLDNV